MPVSKTGQWIALVLTVGASAFNGLPVAAGSLRSQTTADGPGLAAVEERDAKLARAERAEYLLTTIVFWLSKNFDLPAIFEHPQLRFVPARRIAALRLGAASASARPNDVVAVYHDKEKTIYLSESWSGNRPADVSVLVHEMVHHLQHFDKKIFLCPEAREKPAYDAQNKWLIMFGKDLASEFALDPMTIKIATSCM